MADFVPADFLQLAVQLNNDTDADEAAYRTSVNRSYYACHLLALVRLVGSESRAQWKSVLKKVRKKLSKKQSRKAKGDHELTLVMIVNHPTVRAGKAKRISDQLGQLRDLRIQADYELDPAGAELNVALRRYRVSGWDELAHVSLSLASNVLPDIDSLPKY